jgi:hypothetical protein
MKLDLLTSLYVFMLAAFIGFEVIRRVSPLLAYAVDVTDQCARCHRRSRRPANIKQIFQPSSEPSLSSPPPATWSEASSSPTACSRCSK